MSRHPTIRRLQSGFVVLVLGIGTLVFAENEQSVATYPNIQEALNANPEKRLFVPAGDHIITEKIVIRGTRSGLYGPGRIIQQRADQPIIEIRNSEDVEIRDLTLARSKDQAVTDHEAIVAIQCKGLVLENLRIIDNQTRSSAIKLRECNDSRISRCLVRNYMRLSIDDRTGSKDWGYAFNCTDGTGISVEYSVGTLIEGNRVIEDHLVPTPEIKEKHQLGKFVKKNAVKGGVTNQQTWDAEYTDAWQQGSAIIVTSPTSSDFTRIIGNHVENAAQGIDLHSDHVIVSNNVVTNAFIGMKAMHGSRNVLITGNQFTRNSLWAIGLMPGAGSNAGNFDGGSIIANNIISDFGHGDASWIWGEERSPFKFDTGQQPDDPPLTDVIIQGNLVHAIGKPRYQYTVIIAGGENTPRGLRFSNNLFHPGTQGISNTELPQGD
ncbi:hypothetical protein FEM03_05430 [Phragmitibacter flavus]|uniref:Right handed beta helix domain-containing protein n=1 Tax=Phragmitibacter flavus TaxID=2576071 RepID=A0A5R8KHX1_9BACT|nr:right-handed parallel beta-helix repeat-containing protein [Phragmitibacter flavus]TLD71831.1 hypothetical protein FEM03_05430 [Phragmitibacter flavus]